MAETAPQPPAAPENHPYPLALERHKRLRQSLLATFDACPLATKFDLEYRQGWTGNLAAEGQIFHRFAAKALEHMAEQETTTIDMEDGLAILQECLTQRDEDDRDVVAIPFKNIKRLRWTVVKWCFENVFDIKHLVSVEERLEAEVRYGDFGEWPRIISGQLDALFAPERDWAVVPDWKTGWALPPINELSEGGYFQQRVYALLVMKSYRVIERVTLRETYVRLKDPETEAAPVREATVFRSELPDIEQELAALAERFDRAVQDGTWPLPEDGSMPNLWTPAPGNHCSWCPRPTACPIFPTARREGRISSQEEAEKVAAQQVVAKAAAKQADEALKAWAGNRGPIPIRHAKDPNRVLGFKPSTRTSRPTQKQVEDALRDQGADFDPATLYKTEPITRFSAHSYKEPEDTPEDAKLLSALEASLEDQKTTDGAGGAGDKAA